VEAKQGGAEHGLNYGKACGQGLYHALRVKDQCWAILLIFQTTTDSGYMEKPTLKNQLILGIWEKNKKKS
jgi:hypothetical protein